MPMSLFPHLVSRVRVVLAACLLVFAFMFFGAHGRGFADSHANRVMERASVLGEAGASSSLRDRIPDLNSKLFSVVFVREARADEAPAAAAPAVSDGDQFKAIIDAVHQFGGASWALKISLICLIVTALFKVSFLQPLWAKLGPWQAVAAPAIALVAGLAGQGSAITFPGALAYLAAGVGAVGLHELLDAVKGIPGIGSKYVSAINFVESILGAPKAA